MSAKFPLKMQVHNAVWPPSKRYRVIQFTGALLLGHYIIRVPAFGFRLKNRQEKEPISKLTYTVEISFFDTLTRPT